MLPKQSPAQIQQLPRKKGIEPGDSTQKESVPAIFIQCLNLCTTEYPSSSYGRELVNSFLSTRSINHNNIVWPFPLSQSQIIVFTPQRSDTFWARSNHTTVGLSAFRTPFHGPDSRL